ncbi:nicotinamide mononucleotide transporter PnuC [Salmonella phage 19]|nr:nicotinamide mononucleotide transporter PnuC [Salmonella phage 19]
MYREALGESDDGLMNQSSLRCDSLLNRTQRSMTSFLEAVNKWIGVINRCTCLIGSSYSIRYPVSRFT